MIVRSRAIRDAGRTVGILEVRRTLRPLLWRTSLFALLGGIFGAAVFFTFKVFPMAALRKALGQLAREKERAQVTLGSIADGVITTDAEGNVDRMNRPAETVTGWSREEAAGRPIREVFRILDPETGDGAPGFPRGARGGRRDPEEPARPPGRRTEVDRRQRCADSATGGAGPREWSSSCAT